MPFQFGRRHGKGHQKRHKRQGNGMFKRVLDLTEYCICPSCNTKIMRKSGMACYQTNCPNCNNKMMCLFSEMADKTDPKPIVNSELCTGCGLCVKICPSKAIDLKDNTAFINTDKCTNCRSCIYICPVFAIQ